MHKLLLLALLPLTACTSSPPQTPAHPPVALHLSGTVTIESIPCNVNIWMDHDGYYVCRCEKNSPPSDANWAGRGFTVTLLTLPGWNGATREWRSDFQNGGQRSAAIHAPAKRLWLNPNLEPLAQWPSGHERFSDIQPDHGLLIPHTIDFADDEATGTYHIDHVETLPTDPVPQMAANLRNELFPHWQSQD